MTKRTFASLTLAAGMLLAGNAMAQQPAKTTAPPAPAAAQPAQAAKPPAAEPALSNPQAAALLKTEKDKVSYAIGMNIGKSLHRDSVDVDTNLLVRGLSDSLAGGAPLLTDQEAQTILTALQTSLRAKQQEKMQAMAETNQKAGEAFLAANKLKEGIVTLPSGLQYRILKAGDGPKPTATDTVTVNYRGTLIDGTEFDSSYKRNEPATFPVNQVIKGWSEAVQLMPVGSKWQIFIPAELAYGPRGAGAAIGPNATLIFEVELLSIKPKEQPATPTQAQPQAKPQAKPSGK